MLQGRKTLHIFGSGEKGKRCRLHKRKDYSNEAFIAWTKREFDNRLQLYELWRGREGEGLARSLPWRRMWPGAVREIGAVKHNLDCKGFQMIFQVKKQESFPLTHYFLLKCVGMRSAVL